MMAFFPPIIFTVDSSLGKIDKRSLSQQILMELLIENVTNKGKICGHLEAANDLEEWNSIVFNDEQQVSEIIWSNLALEGSLALEWLPTTVKRVIVAGYIFSSAELSGTIDLTALPNGLTCLTLSGLQLQGRISLTTLPDVLEILDLSNNWLSGPLDLTCLPPSMMILQLSGNNFEGVTDFTKLPGSLKELSVSYNKRLEGSTFLHSSELRFAARCTQITVVEECEKKVEDR